MVSEIIRRIIETTQDELGREAQYDDYIRTAHRLFPDEMKKLGSGFERQGFIKWLKSGMRQAVNVDEEDSTAPVVQMDLLPGLAAPAYLDVGLHDEPHLIRFSDALIQDLEIAINTRHRVMRRIGARVEDLQQKLEWLRANQHDANETVGQVCMRLQGQNPRSPPHNNPQHPRETR